MSLDQGHHIEFIRYLSKGIYNSERRAKIKSNLHHQFIHSADAVIAQRKWTCCFTQNCHLLQTMNPRKRCVCDQRTCDYFNLQKASHKLATTLKERTMPYSGCLSVAQWTKWMKTQFYLPSSNTFLPISTYSSSQHCSLETNIIYPSFHVCLLVLNQEEIIAYCFFHSFIF